MNDAEKVPTPEYIEILTEELRVRGEVELELLEFAKENLTQALEILGEDATIRAIRPHVEAEVGRRLRSVELERKRNGLR